MPKYIEKKEAIEALTGWETEPTDMDIEWTINNIPAADVAPVVHGRWERRSDTKDETIYECSKCYRRVKVPHGISKERWAPYCHCGAKMDK